MKRTATCPKCQSTKIGRFDHVADESDATTEPGRRRSLWWQLEGGFWSKTEHRAEVEAYVCTECGYFEEYVKNPGAVSWEKLAPFSWHRPS
jgi:predicted nucleic-acid-binding Zn-ribbon protein